MTTVISLLSKITLYSLIRLRNIRIRLPRVTTLSLIHILIEAFEGKAKAEGQKALTTVELMNFCLLYTSGTWSVAAVLDRCPSLVEGLKEMTTGQANILYAKGSNLISRCV